MTRIEIAKELSAKLGLPQARSIEIIQTVFECVARSLATKVKSEAKKELQIHGFGTFKLIHCKPRVRMNLHARQKIMVPEKFRIKFKPCAELRSFLVVHPISKATPARTGNSEIKPELQT
jgi:nucleoid DNA-binding protein